MSENRFIVRYQVEIVANDLFEVLKGDVDE